MSRILCIAAICLLLTLPGTAIEPDDPGGGGGDPNACWECIHGTAEFPDGGSQDYAFCLAIWDGGFDMCFEGMEGEGCILLWPCWMV